MDGGHKTIVDTSLIYPTILLSGRLYFLFSSPTIFTHTIAEGVSARYPYLARVWVMCMKKISAAILTIAYLGMARCYLTLPVRIVVAP